MNKPPMLEVVELSGLYPQLVGTKWRHGVVAWGPGHSSETVSMTLVGLFVKQSDAEMFALMRQGTDLETLRNEFYAWTTERTEFTRPSIASGLTTRWLGYKR